MTWLAITAAALVLTARSLRRRLLIVTVLGSSMTPTYQDGDRVLVRRMPGHRVRAGQVVLVDLTQLAAVGADRAAGASPVAGRQVKRVAAAPGDPVPPDLDGAGQPTPTGKLVLLGDNPAHSADSRQFGYVPADCVLGVVLRRLQ